MSGPTQGGGIFGTSSPSLFGNNANTAGGQKTSIFGTSGTVSGGQSTGLFGGPNKTTPVAGGTTTQPFQSAGTAVFGGSTPATSRTSGIFGQQATNPPASTQLFGSNPQPSTGATTSIFKGLTSTSKNQPPKQQAKLNLGGTTPTNPSAGGIFGSVAPSSTQPGGIFSSSISQTPTFGVSSQPAGTSIQSGSLFGQKVQEKKDEKQNQTQPASSPFSTATTSQPGGIFGTSTPSTPSQTGLFGVPSSSAGTGGLFTQGTQPTMPSQATTTTVTTTPTPTTATTTTAPIFGGISQTSAASTTQPQPQTQDTTSTPLTGLFTNPNTTSTQQPTTQPAQKTSSPLSGSLFSGTATPQSGMAETIVPNPNLTTTTQPQNISQPINPQDQLQKLRLQYEKSNKTTGEYIDEWKKTLSECYKQINTQCQLFKSFSKDRKQNYTILKNFKQLEPVIIRNKQQVNMILDSIYKRQVEMIAILYQIKDEVGMDINPRHIRQNPIANQIKDCADIRKEVNAEEEKYIGQQDQDASNQQLRNIFFNLETVENEIRKLNHILDHYFGKFI